MDYINLQGTLRFVNGATFSYAPRDGVRRTGTRLYLETMGGKLFFPSSSICGKWRHLNFAMVVLALAKKGVKLNIHELYWLAMGGVKEPGDYKYDVLMDRPRFQKHVFGGFWGFAEPVFQEKKIQIENALLTENDNVEPSWIDGQRVDIFQRGELTPDMAVDPSQFAAYIAKLQGNRDLRNAQDEETDPKKKSAKKTRAEGESMAMNMPHSRQIIPPNTMFNHVVDLIKNPSEIQFGMFLATLRFFAETEPYFGARAGINLGLVDLDYEVTIGGKTFGKIITSGRKRTIKMGADLAAYEKNFWKEFPKLDFTKPVTKEK